MFKKLTLFISSLLIIFLGFTACSDSSTNSSSQMNTGTGSFTISGDVEGNKTGIADFRAYESAGVHTWDILIYDHNPMTFNVSFNLLSNDPIDRPSVGTYELSTGNFQGTEFMGIFTDYSEGMSQSEGYNVGIGGTGGTLTITTSSENLMEGTFEFTAVTFDDDGAIDGSVSVTDGEFSAVPRQGAN